MRKSPGEAHTTDGHRPHKTSHHHTCVCAHACPLTTPCCQHSITPHHTTPHAWVFGTPCSTCALQPIPARTWCRGEGRHLDSRLHVVHRRGIIASRHVDVVRRGVLQPRDDVRRRRVVLRDGHHTRDHHGWRCRHAGAADDVSGRWRGVAQRTSGNHHVEHLAGFVQLHGQRHVLHGGVGGGGKAASDGGRGLVWWGYKRFGQGRHRQRSGTRHKSHMTHAPTANKGTRQKETKGTRQRDKRHTAQRHSGTVAQRHRA